MLKITEMLATRGTNCRPGYAMTPSYITVHNTANTSAGADAEAHARYLRSGGKNTYTSYHYVIDSDGIVRIIPDSEVAWHAGDGANGTGNRKSLSMEICENPESDLIIATDAAAELTAHLMRDYGIPIAHVVQHHFWTGKNCPNRIRAGQPYDWDAFLAKVQAYYNALFVPAEETPAVGAVWTVQTGAFAKYDNAVAYRSTLKLLGVASFILDENAAGLYRVQTGAFAVERNAKNYAAMLKSKGIDTVVVKKEVA
jgi:N-acetylmuramoyl-L-alanine amidase